MDCRAKALPGVLEGLVSINPYNKWLRSDLYLGKDIVKYHITLAYLSTIL